MKFLFIDTYYPAFLKYFRKKYPGVSRQSFQKQRDKLLSECFGTADFYSYNLRKLGFQAEDLIVNDEILQRCWAGENGMQFSSSGWLSKIQSFQYVYKLLGRPKWIQEIILSQIKKAKPDVLYFQDLTVLSPETLVLAKKYCRLLVGQIASPLPQEAYLRPFDLILTSFPHYADYFNKLKIKSDNFKLGFEPRILDKIGVQKRIYDVVFVGSYSWHHLHSMRLVKSLANIVPLHVWGQGIGFINPFSKIRTNYHGTAWGLKMYKILSQAKIIVNRHINVAGCYANNMRLYEATGMGAMLLTDEKKNLNDLFKVGKEIETYNNENELINKAKFYLAHEEKRKEIAAFGQQRTLKEHTYYQRMKELIEIINKHLQKYT